MRQHDLVIEPAPASRVQRIDYFGNAVDQFTILTPYDEMCVMGRSVVEVSRAWRRSIPTRARRGKRSATSCSTSAARRTTRPRSSAIRRPTSSTAPELAAFARGSFPPQRPLVAAAVDLMHRIHDEFTFDPGSTTITTPVTRVLADRHGVCQDFAHLQIGCLQVARARRRGT